MYCEHCGKELPAAAKRCPACGHGPRPEGLGSQALAITSMVLALVGFNIAALVTGLIAIFSRKAGRPFAIAGVAVAGLRLVIGVLVLLMFFWFGIFAYLVSRSEDHGRKPWSTEECCPEDYEDDWQLEQQDDGPNVDTTLTGRRQVIADGVEEELFRLEDRADDLEDGLGDDLTWDQDRLLEQAWAALDSVHDVLPDLGQANEEDEMLELAGEAHRLLIAAGGALDVLGTE